MGFWVSSLCLVHMGSSSFSGLPVVYKTLGLLWCASCWTRPLGGGRWGYYLGNHWEEHLKVHKTPYEYLGKFMRCYVWKPYMLALVGQPRLRGCDACMVYSVKWALRRNCRQKQRKTSFSPLWRFSV